MKRSYQTGFILLLVMFCSLPLLLAESGRKLPKGAWGGQGVRMEVTESGAELEFGCGAATITGPITLDQNGNFRVSGTYTQGNFGPTREGAASGREASFTGSVDGDTLKLEMVMSSDDRVQKFTVTHGRESKLIKCK